MINGVNGGVVKGIVGALLALGISFHTWFINDRIKELEESRSKHMSSHEDIQKQLGDIKFLLGKIEGKLNANSRN